ncbi:hypothetical protein PMAG_b0296 [Pseudoalteromonas mariniglutinosa NCIMB 1770]|nr:hypothetical protein [Pseudoalteromonas mariniglutinosa NCIMB 1770]
MQVLDLEKQGEVNILMKLFFINFLILVGYLASSEESLKT